MKLTERLDIPMSEADLSELKRRAKEAGMSASEFGRTVVQVALYGREEVIRRRMEQTHACINGMLARTESDADHKERGST